MMKTALLTPSMIARGATWAGLHPLPPITIAMAAGMLEKTWMTITITCATQVATQVMEGLK